MRTLATRESSSSTALPTQLSACITRQSVRRHRPRFRTRSLVSVHSGASDASSDNSSNHRTQPCGSNMTLMIAVCSVANLIAMLPECGRTLAAYVRSDASDQPSMLRLFFCNISYLFLLNFFHFSSPFYHFAAPSLGGPSILSCLSFTMHQCRGCYSLGGPSIPSCLSSAMPHARVASLF